MGRKANNRTAKDYSITRIIKEMIDEPVDERWLDAADKGKGLTWRQAIAKRQLIECVRGNATLIKELNERLDGKVTQPISGEGGEPIKTEIIVSSQSAKNLLTEIKNGVAPHAPSND